MNSKLVFINIMLLLMINKCNYLEILSPDEEVTDGVKYRYALTTHLSPENPVKVTLSNVVNIEYDKAEIPFKSAVNDAFITLNDSIIYPNSYYGNLRGRQQGYNYINRNYYPKAGQIIKVRAVIDTINITGSSIIPGHFEFINYSENTITWSASSNAKIYNIRASYNINKDLAPAWNEFVDVLTFDTTLAIHNHINYEKKTANISEFDSIKIEITAYDENYYKAILNNQLQSGVYGSYGSVSTSHTIDTTYGNR